MTPARLAGGNGQAGEHGELAGERLGRGDADLGPGERRQDRIGFPRDRRLAHIDDRENVLPLRAAIAQRGERIGRLARLRDEQRRAAGIERGLAIAELRGDIDIDRQFRPALEPIFGDEAGIEGGAAGGEREPRDLGEVEGQLRDVDTVGGEIDIAGERMADHFRLFVDLLCHEMAVVAFVDEQRRGERAGHSPLHRVAVPVADGNGLRASSPPSRRPRDRRSSR